MNEQRLSELMQHSRLQMPFSDFEERTMARIHRESRVKADSRRYKKLSRAFFVLGAVLGALATHLVTALPGMATESVILVSRLGYVILLLVAFNYLLPKTRTSQT